MNSSWLFTFTLLAAGRASAFQDAPPVPAGSRLQLFVDDYLIESMNGVELRLHEPRRAGIVFQTDAPWEGNTSAYFTVLYDGARYRMYYRGSAAPAYVRKSVLAAGVTPTPAHPEFACYAESADGIRWTRPALRLHEFEGSSENNIIWAEKGTSHNFAPFADANPAAPAEARYKALAGDGRGLVAFQSADGIRWHKVREQPVITDGRFDSLNVAFWDETASEYVAVYRDFRDKVRTFKCARSKDFLNWTKGEWADFGEQSPIEQLYTNATVPYFRAPQIFLAFPKRFIMDRTMHEDISIAGISESVLMSSRDGVRWRRPFLEAFVRPGLDPSDWVHRNNMVARGVVPTGSNEISIYVSRHYTYPTCSLERLTLRTDGFASVHAGYAGGEFTTRLMRVDGKALVLNFATSAAGMVRVEILDSSGKRLEQTPAIFGDFVSKRVPLREPLSSPVRLRISMKDADLYSLQFTP